MRNRHAKGRIVRFLAGGPLLLTAAISLRACPAGDVMPRPQAVPETNTANTGTAATDAATSGPRPVEPHSLVPMPADAVRTIRQLAVNLIPEVIESDDEWGRHARIQSGLDVRMEGLELRTKRRWKDVNHGLWKKVALRFEQPEETLQIAVFQMPGAPKDAPDRLLTASARLRVSAQVQQWNLGVMLWSVSAEAVADVSFRTEFRLGHSLIHDDGGLTLQIEPEVRNSAVRLDGFSLRRVSRMKGAMIRETGEFLEPMLRSLLARESQTLDADITRRIDENHEKLRIPLGSIGTLFSKP